MSSSREEASKMSLDEYINVNPGVVVSRKKSRKYRGNYKSQHSPNSECDIEMLVDQFNGNDQIGKSIWNALSQLFRLQYPNRPAKFYKRRNFNSNQRRRNRGAPAYEINRNLVHLLQAKNKQTNFKRQNLRSSTATSSCVPTGTNRIATNSPQILDSLTSQTLSNPDEQKYDMEIQEIISEIQGKTLYSTCASDPQSVISLDGPGIDDGQFEVSTTSITLNQRFS